MPQDDNRPVIGNKVSDKTIDENPSLDDFVYGIKADGTNVLFRISDIKTLVEAAGS